MGLYQSLDLMVINGLLDGFDKNDTGIIALPVVKYVYKLSCDPTGHFYIGQTHNLKNRFYTHITNIACAGSGKDDLKLKFHQVTGPLLKQLYDQWELKKKKRPEFEFFVRRSVSAYIYAICGDQISADLLQKHYSDQFKNDPLFLK